MEGRDLFDRLFKAGMPLAVVSLLAMGSPSGAQEAAADASVDIMAGEEIFQSVCRNCHGPKAQGVASFPKLAGQDAETLTILLEEYRAGETLGPNTTLMAPHAKDLSDADIANIAAYVATSFE